jgi:hypothetical protein
MLEDEMIPETIRVGAYTITVKRVKNIILDDQNAGTFNPRTMEIQIDENICEPFRYGVLWHEIVEAIKHIYAIKALDADHDAICSLGEALNQLMVDNYERLKP